jgi:hypothetical protein
VSCLPRLYPLVVKPGHDDLIEIEPANFPLSSRA